MKALNIIIIGICLFLVTNSYSQTTKTFYTQKDASISTNTPDANNGNSTTFYSYLFEGKIGVMQRSLIEVDLSSIPQGSTILNATLKLSGVNHLGGNESYLSAITDIWDENTVTWNNQPTYDKYTSVYLPNSTYPTEDYSVDITTICQSWTDGTVANNGLILRIGQVSFLGTNQLSFASSDYADSTKWPYLEVTYELPTTKLINSDCGATGVNFDQTLTANEIIGASLYIFHVINYNLGFNTTVSKTLNSFSLSELNQQINFNTPYLINVSVVLGQDTLNSSDTCIITTFDPDQDFNNYQNQVIYDRFGNTYSLDEITRKPNDPNSLTVIAGRFAITFTNPIIYTPQVVATITQVFDDLNNLITSQSCGTNLPDDLPYVNIQINAPTGMDPGIPGAAISSSFYAPLLQACCNPNENSGVLESEVWRAINTGVNNPILFDGVINLNFFSPAWAFNTDLFTPTTTSPPQIDLYTVVLHETMHVLGFASLIGSNGLSIFAPGNNMYSRYDLFLNDNTGLNFINWTTPYNTLFNVPVASLSAGCTDIRFQGTNTIDEPITNINSGALSHIDNLCLTPPITEPMTPGLSYGEEKRTITPRDANILLDLGYQLTGNFGDGTLPFHTTGLPSGGPGVIGRPDGLNGFNINCANPYQLELCNPGTDYIVIDDIFPNTFLSNDINVVGFEGLELLQGNTTFVEDHTTNQITVTPNSPGLITFRYVPIDASGNRGNYTCIFVNVISCQTCLNPDVCNLVCNSDMQCYTENCYPPGATGVLPQSWSNSHGTSDWINWNWVTPPDPGFVRTGARGDIIGSPNGIGEGVLGILNGNIIAGNTYIFSYWRRRGGDLLDENQLQHVYVKLINSAVAALSGVPTTSYDVPILPVIPGTSQLIVEESNVISLLWEQVVVCFTANANYDKIWIYPHCETGSMLWGTLYIDRVQLAPFNPNFAGSDITSACANNITIGTDICTVDNMQFEWTNSSGIIGSNEQIQVPGDISETYQLQLILPANPTNVVFPAMGNNCITTDQVNVNYTGGITINTNINNDFCGLCNGSATVIPTNGIAPYTYLWDAQAGGGNFQTATNLCAGNYTVTVTDANNCIGISPIINITENILPIPVISGSLSYCAGSNTTLDAGSGYISYLWSTGATTQTVNATITDNPINVTVTDINGCSASTQVNVTVFPAISSSIISTDASCSSSCDGTATITPQGGLSPYTYLWNDPTNQTTQIATNLCAGNYSVIITDANNCTATNNVTISNATGPAITLETITDSDPCCNGSITITPESGVTYTWSTVPAQSGTTISNLCPDNYTVTATATNGCTSTQTFTINSLLPATFLYPCTTIYVSSGITLISAANFGFCGQYIVNSGATLNINSSTIYFTPGSGITVLSGGTLIINNSTLTSFCNEMWNGINATGTATAANPISNTWLTIDGSYIENAIRGVDANVCVLRTSNSHYINNSYDLYLRYLTPSPYSIIESDHFITTSLPLLPPANKPFNHIIFNNPYTYYNSVHINLCEFDNLEPYTLSNMNDRGNGITSFNTRTEITNSTFKWLQYGVSTNSNTIITGGTFTDNNRGVMIQSTSSTNSEVHNNTFNVGNNGYDIINPQATLNWGLSFNNCPVFDVYENIFNNGLIGLHTKYFDNTGGNIVYNNEFNNMYAGIVSSDINNILFNCNRFRHTNLSFTDFGQFLSFEGGDMVIYNGNAFPNQTMHGNLLMSTYNALFNTSDYCGAYPLNSLKFFNNTTTNYDYKYCNDFDATDIRDCDATIGGIVSFDFDPTLYGDGVSVNCLSGDPGGNKSMSKGFISADSLTSIKEYQVNPKLRNRK